MTIVIDEQGHEQEQDEVFLLFVVWIDTNMGYSETDWEMNSPPQPLHSALYEAAETRSEGYPTVIMIEGKTPRPDGLFSNPMTD